jgi:glycosyltransferase involved in cell wall biosynthesis
MDDESDHLLNQLKKLERRMEVLEGQLQNAIESYSRARYLARRIRIRPPIWNFEQYSPRRLAMPAVEHYLQTSNSEFRIAIVTPCYNSSAYLRAAIDSVLTQGYAKVSYVVQDGGSNDDTVSILREYGDRIRWRSERDDGQAQAINRGFAGVECDIMGYLNADDVLLPGTLKYVSHFFQTHPDVDFVYGHRVFIDCDGSEIGRAVLPKHDGQALKLADYVPQETMFWRRQVFDAIGSFDEDFHYALDWDFILRAQAAGFKFVRVPRFLACFRVHDAQKTSKLYDTGRREMRLLRQRYLGYVPAQSEIYRRLLPYLTRQLLCHWMYKCGLLRL